MNLAQFVEVLLHHSELKENISFAFTREAKPARYAPLPEDLHPAIASALKEQGILELYSHQRETWDYYQRGRNIVITTPTASGKTLSYLLPILQAKLLRPQSRHLFLFPTKALAQDQLAVFRRWKEQLQQSWQINTYDGDTPPEERRNIKQGGDLVLSNPDMLHSGILPHHTNWKKFFENLETIVIDEMHTYLGVFGSHVANVLRRLNRLLAHYDNQPKFIFSSATIANPLELAEQLAERPFELVSQSGAPEGPKYFIFYNPPVIDDQGNRQSPYRAAATIGAELLKNEIPTIFFARSRNRVEVLTTLLRNRLPYHLKNSLQGYRGGYLPLERRRIERDLRSGKLTGVVSTNALELGIDIGMLQAVVSVGYPGRMSSLLQQFGRAGRQKDPAMAVMIATPSALDQYLVRHADTLIQSGGEAAIINPENLMIYSDHIKCAAYELPFYEGDRFGAYQVDDFLDYLCDEQVLLKKQGRYFWMKDIYPAANISLRSAAQDNFVIVDVTDKGNEKVIGEVDYFSAPLLIHEEAIYLHRARHYFVERLMWDKRRAEVVEVKDDYYTDAHQKIHIAILHKDKEEVGGGYKRTWGELTVIAKAHLYKKIKISTNENLGWGQIHTPEIEMHTQGAWLEFSETISPALTIANKGGLMIRFAYLLHQIAPLIALCDQSDITIMGLYRDPQFSDFAVVAYDHYPGGVGLSYKLLQSLNAWLEKAEQVVRECRCSNGCPSCIGVWDSESIEDLGYLPDDARQELLSISLPTNYKTAVLQLFADLRPIFS